LEIVFTVLSLEDDSLDSVADVISGSVVATSPEPYSDAKAISDLVPFREAIIISVMRRAPPGRVNLLLFTV
jgi:hypothetical protein